MSGILSPMRRLFPHPTDHLTVEEYCGIPRQRLPHRPHVMLCMVASVDGATVVDGNSRALGGPTDQQVLLGLRRHADVILVGASTVRADGYGAPRPGLRIAVVSRRCDFDFDQPLWASGQAVLVVPADAAIGELPVPVVRAGTGTVDLADALTHFHDAHVVQAEGGPTINGLLAAADLLDEVNLTVSPLLVGGDGPRVVHHAPPVRHRLHLSEVCEADDGFLFTRYTRR